jgi:GNAT superfamily N-acetyltransferase
MNDLHRLKFDVAATFVISGSGRIERGPSRHLGPRQESTEEIRPGPRLFFAGCAAGNIAHVRHDVDGQTALRVLAVAENEPPWRDPDVPPHCLDEIVDLLSRSGPVEIVGPEVVFDLSHGLRYEHSATIVQADTAEGDELLGRLMEKGLPQSLLDAGFLSLEDLWWPWSVALEGRDIASMAFSPRLTKASAEIGVFTFPAFRGRGLAAAVTASWSALECLSGRALIYSTRTANRASRNVAARLGLRSIGARVCIN